MSSKTKKKRNRKPTGKLDDLKVPVILKPKVSFSPHGNRTFTTNEELREGIREYIEYKKIEGRPVTVAGLCVWFSIHRDTLHMYESGLYDYENNKFSDTVKEAKTFIENDKLELGLMDIYNSQIVKFDLGHNHGYVEKSEVNSNITQKTINANVDFKDPQKAFEAYKGLIKKQ